MKKQVTRTTPARAEVVETVNITLCDVCDGKRLGHYRCKVCGRDVCNVCSVNSFTSGSDYIEKTCLLCYDLRETYMPQINVTESAQEAAEDKIRAAWKAESRGKKSKEVNHVDS